MGDNSKYLPTDVFDVERFQRTLREECLEHIIQRPVMQPMTVCHHIAPGITVSIRIRALPTKINLLNTSSVSLTCTLYYSLDSTGSKLSTPYQGQQGIFSKVADGTHVGSTSNQGISEQITLNFTSGTHIIGKSVNSFAGCIFFTIPFTADLVSGTGFATPAASALTSTP